MARSLYNTRGVGSARTLLALAAATLVAGCLTPPPIEEQQVTESEPIIDRTRVDPVDTLLQFNLRAEPRAFELFSVEPAVSYEGDWRAYWYVLEEEGLRTVPPVSAFRTFYYEPCDDEAYRPAPDDPQQHLFVEVDITDQPRLQGPDGEDLPEPRSYPEDAFVATITWVVLFADSTCGE